MAFDAPCAFQPYSTGKSPVSHVFLLNRHHESKPTIQTQIHPLLLISVQTDVAGGFLRLKIQLRHHTPDIPTAIPQCQCAVVLTFMSAHLERKTRLVKPFSRHRALQLRRKSRGKIMRHACPDTRTPRGITCIPCLIASQIHTQYQLRGRIEGVTRAERNKMIITSQISALVITVETILIRTTDLPIRFDDVRAAQAHTLGMRIRAITKPTLLIKRHRRRVVARRLSLIAQICPRNQIIIRMLVPI